MRPPVAPIAAALMAALTMATPAEAAPNAVELDYRVYFGGMRVLELTSVLVLGEAADYRMAVSAATTGLIGSMIKAGYRSRSEGLSADGRPRPRRFVGTNIEDDQDRNSVTVTWRDGAAPEVAFTPADAAPDEPLPEPVTVETVDPASAMLTLMETLARSGRCDVTIKVFDGRRRYNLRARQVAERTLKASKLAPYGGPAIECSVGFERVAGFREGRLAKRYPDEITVFLAPVLAGTAPVPVRLHANNLFGAFRMHLVGWRAVDAPEAAAIRE